MMTIERFVASLGAAGVLPPEEVAALEQRAASMDPAADADGIARQLVNDGKLTRFQAAAAYQDKAATLLLGNYLVLDRIGAGGMGQVFRARHRKMDRVVAIKILPRKRTASADAVQRFQREVKAAARLTHPHIVTAHDADEAGGVHFLVMEYVEGCDLSSLVRNDGPLPVEKAVDYVIQAARGLEHAHAEGIIHRDIKPSNLLLDKRGTVKLLDLGLARMAAPTGSTDGSGASDLTQSGSLMGTVDYIAPEQALDTHQADQRADIYSLGCTLFFLLLGRPPYGGETMVKRLLAHREQPAPSLSAERRAVPAELDAVFRRMVAKRPQQRYASMNEVIAALEPFARPGAARRAKRRKSPLPLVLAGAGTAVVTIAVIAALLSGGKHSQVSTVGNEAASAREPAKRPASARRSEPAKAAALAIEGPAPPLNSMADRKPPANRPQAKPEAAAVPAKTLVASSAVVQKSAAPTAPAKAKSPLAKPPGEQKPAAAAMLAAPQRPPGPHSPAPVVSEKEKSPPMGAATADQRLPLPATPARATAERLLRETFQADYAALKQPEDHAALAKKLLAEAAKTPNSEPASAYVLLSDAERMAVEAADVELIDQTAYAMATRFQLQRAELLADAAEQFNKRWRLPAVSKILAEKALSWIDGAISDEQFPAASRLAAVTIEAARRSKDGLLSRQAVDRNKSVAALVRGWEAAQKARTALDADPDDPKANTTLGRYLCFAKGDWEQGLPKLARGDDPLLKQLAAQGLPIPTAPTALAELGDAWWKASESAKSKAKADLQAGAAYWYALALPQMTGLAKVKLENRLKQLGRSSRASSPARSQITPVAADPRAVAAWIFSTGGAIQLALPTGESQPIKSAEELPGDAFAVHTVDLRGSKLITDAHIQNLYPFTGLKSLLIDDTNLTDQALAMLMPLKEIDNIGASGTKITDAGLDPMANMPNLHRLSLSNNPGITDAALPRLAQIPKLFSVSMHNTKVTADRVPEALQHLHIEGLGLTGMTDEGVAKLRLLPNLKWCGIPHGKFSDAALAHLVGLNKIVMVDLWGNQSITDAAFEQLARLPRLTDLKVKETRVTDAGVKRFKALRPDCKVVH